MAFTFQNPVIDTSTMDEKEQLRIMQSWLYQLTDELRHALTSLNAGDIYFENESSPLNQSVSTAQKQSVAEGYDSLRELIIKTADSVESASDYINKKLTGEYVAQSEFGAYKVQVENDIEATADAISLTYASKEMVSSRITADGSISAVDPDSQTDETRQYIKCGYLYGTGADKKYGVAVGENLTIHNGELVRSNLATTMTSDRISFWNAGNEVAYISNNNLYINEADILGRLKVGNWSIETDNGFAIKWNENQESVS